MQNLAWLTSLAFALVALVSAQAPRKDQVFVERGLYFTAERVYPMQQKLKDQLLNVSMWFDVLEDSTYRGEFKKWSGPAVAFYDPNYWKTYLEDSSCLGPSSPLGHNGPLGSDGPITLNGGYAPEKLAGFLNDTRFGGLLERVLPFAAAPNDDWGPLGKYGPLTEWEMYNTMYHLNSLYSAEDYPINLDITGVWAILGPQAPMGALGALGPLGPMGPHLYRRNSNGEYLDTAGKVVRSLRIAFDDAATPPISRLYDLYEHYPAAFAAALAENNDASFLAEGTLRSTADSAKFRFTSTHTQSVSALAVPNGAVFSDLDLRLSKRVANGSFVPIAQSMLKASYSPDVGYIDWIIFRAAQGEVFEVTISTKTSRANVAYRLFVTGSGFSHGVAGQERDANMFNHWNILGPHQSNFCKEVRAAC